MYEVELLKSIIVHRQSITVEFFKLQNAKLRMLELYLTSMTSSVM